MSSGAVRALSTIAVLVVAEAAIAFLAIYAAVLIRFQTSRLQLLELEIGPLWPRGLVFAAIIVGCLRAFDLYNTRQRPQTDLLRLGAALTAALVVLVAVTYVFPRLAMWRWVPELAVGITAAGVLGVRLLGHRIETGKFGI
jgi:FlaA1/EpsC-like NDP-sugar epimerase